MGLFSKIKGLITGRIQRVRESALGAFKKIPFISRLPFKGSSSRPARVSIGRVTAPVKGAAKRVQTLLRKRFPGLAKRAAAGRQRTASTTVRTTAIGLPGLKAAGIIAGGISKRVLPQVAKAFPARISGKIQKVGKIFAAVGAAAFVAEQAAEALGVRGGAGFIGRRKTTKRKKKATKRRKRATRRTTRKRKRRRTRVHRHKRAFGGRKVKHKRLKHKFVTFTTASGERVKFRAHVKKKGR